MKSKKRVAASDVTYVKLRRGRIVETVEVRPGVLLDLDKRGELVGIEIIQGAKRSK